MGSSPYSPSYGLLLSNLSNGSYTFHIGRAYNKTWLIEVKYYLINNFSFLGSLTLLMQQIILHLIRLLQYVLFICLKK